MEKTLAMIKPDGVGHGLIGEVIKRIEKGNFSVLAMRMVQLDKEEAEGFYAEHKGKPFFNDLIEFMCSGPIVIMVLERINAVIGWRMLIGVADSAKAHQGSIRANFGNKEIIRCNVVHGSSSLEAAKREINYFLKYFFKENYYV